MKRNFLIIVFCLCCVAAFAQTTKPTPKKKVTPGTKTGTGGKSTAGRGKKPVPKPKPTSTTAVNPPPTVVSPANSTTTAQPTGTDTTRKLAGPVKPFDRPLDGYYKETNILSAKVTPYPNLREADVSFRKRVWEEIDVREKMNTYMASPKARLIDVLMDAIEAGELTAYDPTPNPKDDPNGDQFGHPLKPSEVKGRLVDSALVTKSDTAGNVLAATRVAGTFSGDSVVRYRIKEDWIFDKQRSEFAPRIIGLAPMIKPKAAAGIPSNDYQPAFWVYFPEARQVLVTKAVVSARSDATGLSYDDVFMKRLFKAYIVKASNNKDERIKDQFQGIDRLYEAERIKKEMMDWELDLWQY